VRTTERQELGRGEYMTARSVLSGIVLGLSFSLISPQGAAGQSSTSSTETEVIPEADAHIEMASNWRVLGFSGVQQGVGYNYQQWYAAAALGYQLKPILTPHRENIDPDKEHYFLFGGGYEFLRTTQSGTVKDENRIAIEALVGFRPSSDFLIRDRNRIEFRWVNGAYSTTYRNMPSLERDFLVHGVRFTPYAAVEVFYDGSKQSWNQEWYTGGIQWPYKRVFMLDTYYRREHCSTCTPESWNAAGVTLNFFFKSGK
jgi:Protein of unknown function (DUF2490)